MNKVKKIPSLLALLFLIIGLVVVIYLTGQATFFSPKASSSCSPINIQITNLTYKSFDISFLTDKQCDIVANINQIVYVDSRQLSKTKTHYFQIDNLKPQTDYQYSFLSEGKEYSFYNFIKAIQARYNSRIKEQLANLLSYNESGIRVIYTLTKTFTQLLEAKLLSQRGQDNKQIASKMRLNPYIVKKIRNDSKNYTEKEIREIILLLLKLEVEYKRGRLNDKLVPTIIAAHIIK